MRLATANPQPFQFDVVATSSIPSLLPKISFDPAVAAQGTGRVHARHSRHSEKQTKGHGKFAHSADGARFAFAWERSTKWLGKPSPTSVATRRKTMGLWKYARQRLVPFVVALLGIALLCALFGDIPLAEDAAPPACGGKILGKCNPHPRHPRVML